MKVLLASTKLKSNQLKVKERKMKTPLPANFAVTELQVKKIQRLVRTFIALQTFRNASIPIFFVLQQVSQKETNVSDTLAINRLILFFLTKKVQVPKIQKQTMAAIMSIHSSAKIFLLVMVHRPYQNGRAPNKKI